MWDQLVPHFSHSVGPKPLPASGVLADLFDVSGMSLDVPDHVLEDEPGLELVPCAVCEGKGWIERERLGNVL